VVGGGQASVRRRCAKVDAHLGNWSEFDECIAGFVPSLSPSQALAGMSCMRTVRKRKLKHAASQKSCCKRSNPRNEKRR